MVNLGIRVRLETKAHKAPKVMPVILEHKVLKVLVATLAPKVLKETLVHKAPKVILGKTHQMQEHKALRGIRALKGLKVPIV